VKPFWVRHSETFNGCTVYAPPGLREDIVETLLSHAQPPGSLLDLGSGYPVVSHLVEAGFDAVRSIARSTRLAGITPEPTPNHPDALDLDLSERFSQQIDGEFDVVTSSEVIEHLPCPRAFMEEVSRLLVPGGILLLTTPNVSNWIGRLRFLVFGELRWFDADGARQMNHISPITDSQMRLMLEETGYELLEAKTAGSFLSPLGVILTSPLSLPFVLLHGRRAWGDSNIYVARAPRRDSRSKS
jgi:SAM-dependent methyltransferase